MLTSPAEACTGADVVITMLTDLDAVLSVVAAAGLSAGTTLIEMSTIGPEGVAKLADALPVGVGVIDAPVAGSVGAASSGVLGILVGGEAEVIESVEPVLLSLGRVRRCGQLGRGAAYKLVLNAAVITGVAAVADAIAVGRSVGLSREDTLTLLEASPLTGLVDRARGGPGASFAVKMAAKDLNLALSSVSAPVPVAMGATELLRQAVVNGDATADLSAISDHPAGSS